MVVYTDGVSEAKNRAGHHFGLERFSEFLKNQRATSADEFADQLLDELRHWIGRGCTLTVLVADSVVEVDEAEEENDEADDEKNMLPSDRWRRPRDD